MGRHLVFAGGGHAHLTALLNLHELRNAGARVTLISPSAYHYYSGMGPGLLSGLYRPQEVRFHVRKMVEDRGAAFIEDVVVKVDPERRTLLLGSGNTAPYDIVSFNTGSEILFPDPGPMQDNTFTVKPIVNLLKARQYILQRISVTQLHVCIIGGGPAGVELAGNVRRISDDAGGRIRITLLAGARLLKHLPDRARLLALRSLSDRGISVTEGRHVTKVADGAVALDDGSSVPFDVALLATGVTPPTMFRRSGLPTGDDGGLLVNAYLQNVRYPEIFGGGDCISLEHYRLPRVGVHAVRENPVLHYNLRAFLRGDELRPFVPQRQYLLIFNMGNDRGIFWRGNMVWEGRTAFKLKDYIDRKFMRKFQVSGELAE
jgi:NADH dehydrogenase FAD-containing subunit